MSRFNISEEQFIKFGIEESIVIESELIKIEWENLKYKIYNGSEDTFVRGYGRDAKGTDLYMDMYKVIFGHNCFKKDGTNNSKPKALLESFTGVRRTEKSSGKYKSIRNYQVSHIFGKTKNPFAFTAPWNIVYLPKIVDPLTGHESQGDLTNKFSKEIKNHTLEKNYSIIQDFNKIMIELSPKITKHLNSLKTVYENKYSKQVLDKFKNQVELDFQIIEKE